MINSLLGFNNLVVPSDLTQSLQSDNLDLDIAVFIRSAKPLFFRYFCLILKGLANLSRISICRFIITAILMNYIGVAACVRNLAGAAATRAEGCDPPFLLIPFDLLLGRGTVVGRQGHGNLGD